jgi:tripartite-type tricarboxylate transporter receptor subunit TctC
VGFTVFFGVSKMMHYVKQGAIAVLAVIIAKRLPMVKDYL